MQARNYFLLALTTLSLTACVTGAQMQMAQMNNSLTQAGEDTKACIIENYRKQEYDPIKPYLPAPENNFMPTVEQMAIEKVPTALEAKLLAKYQKGGMPCRVVFFNKLDASAPMLTQIFRESTAKQDKTIMQLVKRQISWGKALENIQQYTLEGQQKLSIAGQQIQNNFQSMHQSEMAQRQAANDKMMQWSLEQQRINATLMPMPQRSSTIHCSDDRLGGRSFSCTQW